MPFIQRVVEPIYLSRRSLHKENGEPLVTDYELEAVTNNTLSSALRQLASLVLIADDIFSDLSKQLQDVTERSQKLRTKIDLVEAKVSKFDPKRVTVPEGDLSWFSERSQHFQREQEVCTGLFTAATRSDAVRLLYEAAAKTPVPSIRQLDRYRRDGHRSSRFFLCTPVLGAKRPHVPDVETRMPAAVTELRRWTSSEAFGETTVAPDCSVLVAAADETDHRLPSPAEQQAVVALRFPPTLVAVDVSGRVFHRMAALRHSHGQGTARGRKPRARRRNTIAGTDVREICQAVQGDETTATPEDPDAINLAPDSSVPSVTRSASSDLLGTKDESPTESKKSHFSSLKNWGKVKLKLIRGKDSTSPANSTQGVPNNSTNVYESIPAPNLPISTVSATMNMAVKLREKCNRKDMGNDGVHSSSGNWSASSESGRASLGSSTSTSHHPRSTTTQSSASRKALNTSTSSSGTITPDIASLPSHDAGHPVPFMDDGETSSVYSCDTEGYYTSFHMDSGLKTLKEEDPNSVPQTPLHSTSALSISPGRCNSTLTAESEYELFGKGSTSTTTSSAGTVCTTLMVPTDSNAGSPVIPERKSSLEQKVVALVHKPSESPDSGHNTSSSPIESSSPQGTLNGRGSECEFSESDIEGVDRIERIRIKTTINSSRIPSMCVITPPQSDDEFSQYGPLGTQGLPRFEKQMSTESDCSNDLDKVTVEKTSHKSPLQPLHSMIDKVKEVLSPTSNKKKTEEMNQVDAGDYVTIADVRNNAHSAPIYSNTPQPIRETEYISLNDIPAPRQANMLASPTDSLERKRRQGARVTLDSEGKVVYSSDSLKRNKRGHSTFEPGPYVKESSSNNASPVPPHRVPKSNIRPARKCLSPQLIIRAASKTSPMTRVASPTSCVAPTIVARPLSPQQPPRGAYVNMQSQAAPSGQSEEEGKAKATLYNQLHDSPLSSKVKRSDSYRLANSPLLLSRKVSNIEVAQNVAARSVLGKSFKSDFANVKHHEPNLIKNDSHMETNLKTKQLADQNEEEKLQFNNDDCSIEKVVLNPNLLGRKCYGPQIHVDPKIFTSVPIPKDTERARVLNNPGQHMTSPPRYISPPHPPLPTIAAPTVAGYWTLPSRRQQIEQTVTLPTNQHLGSGRFNTIGSGSHPYTQNFSSQGAFNSSQRTVIPNGAETFHNLQHSLDFNSRQPVHPNNTTRDEKKRLTELRQSFFSSTPTKDRVNSMDMSAVYSPIQKNLDYNKPSQTPNILPARDLPSNPSKENVKLSPPKSTMTSEELFAAIHKSKKRLNIKIDSDSRSASPSLSSLASLSPGSSESSICGNQRVTVHRNGPERGTFDDNRSRNRHSWSPNSDEPTTQHFTNNLKFLPTPGARQSWACDRLGPVHQTSRNDFKRLLLQQGVKSSVLGIKSPTKLSAVEQLKLSRNQSQEPQTLNSPQNMHYQPRSSADKRTNASKLIHSPRSPATWRYLSPRTDILSSTIPEDCAEDENDSNSPSEKIKSPNTPTYLLSNNSSGIGTSGVRRSLYISPVGTSTSSGSANKPELNILQKSQVSTILKQYQGQNPRQNSSYPQLKYNNNQNHHVKFADNVSLLQTSQMKAPELLSPSNIKENLNTNYYHNTFYANSSGKTPLQHNLVPKVPHPQGMLPYSGTDTRQSLYNGSTSRSILKPIDPRSPKSTLETAL